MSIVSIRDLGRNPSGVVDEVARSGRPALVTRNGRPVAALVRLDQVALEDWALASVGDPELGQSLEQDPTALVHIAAASRANEPLFVPGVSDDEAKRFWAAVVD